MRNQDIVDVGLRSEVCAHAMNDLAGKLVQQIGAVVIGDLIPFDQRSDDIVFRPQLVLNGTKARERRSQTGAQIFNQQVVADRPIIDRVEPVQVEILKIKGDLPFRQDDDFWDRNRLIGEGLRNDGNYFLDIDTATGSRERPLKRLDKLGNFFDYLLLNLGGVQCSNRTEPAFKTPDNLQRDTGGFRLFPTAKDKSLLRGFRKTGDVR